MKHLLLGLAMAAVAAVVGFTCQDDPFDLTTVAGWHPGDQTTLAHRDSAYTEISWIVSQDSNYAQLRFFDKVEGGVCLDPSWDTYAGLGVTHLAMPPGAERPGAPPYRTWPAGRAHPNPGTVTQTRYISLYPTGILLNETLVQASGGDARMAPARVLIVGLGSGVGVANLAHHFPQAAITVVDIDEAVIAMVRDHFPLLRWLETITTAAREPRLRLVCRDARQFVQAHREAFDLVILDAYTSGSTIPPHLMTQEFYAEVAAALRPGGICLSNIIASYTGEKRLVLGGAIRSLREAGLTQVMSFPVVREKVALDSDEIAFREETRNNVVLASRQPLDPAGAADGWKRLRAFVSYADLPPRADRPDPVAPRALVYLGESGRGQGWVPVTTVAALDRNGADAGLVERLHALRLRQGRREADGTPLRIDDPDLTRQVREAVLARTTSAGRTAADWQAASHADSLAYNEFDGVEFSRSIWRTTIDLGADAAGEGAFRYQGVMLVGPTVAERAAVAAASGDTDEAVQRSLAAAGVRLPLSAVIALRAGTASWTIPDAPLFTDARPNADILNR